MDGPRPRSVAPGIVRSAADGDERLLSEVANVLEGHEEELRTYFEDWLADLNRMQREHCALLTSLTKRLQDRVQKPKPNVVSTPEVAKVVEAPLCPPPSFGGQAFRSSGQASELAKLVMKSTNASVEAWVEPSSPTSVVDLTEPDQPNVPTTTEDAADRLSTMTFEEKKRKSRFGEPVHLLYGKERQEQQSVAKSKPTLETQQPKSLAFRKPRWKKRTVVLEGTRFQRFVRSGEVRAVCSLAILANALYMGIYAQMQLQALIHHTPKPSEYWEHAETGFCVFFMLELLLRLLAEGKNFLSKEDAPWNLFDTFLVILSAVDIILTQFDALTALNFTFARTLRIFRFARILRIVRVMRFFYSFRLMVYSVIYSIVSLLWVFMMLLFVIYFFAIFFLHGVTDYFTNPEHADPELHRNLDKYYGTVPDALLSLFMGICGGIDWIELMEPLSRVSWAYGVMFLFYIFFMVFGVLNVVMASFVDSASQISRKDRELVTQNEMERQKQYAQNIRRFFHEADVDKTGTLSWEEFQQYLQNDKVQAYFQSFELDVTQARTLFKLLDLDESNDVGIDEFVEGCLRMKGTARSIDVNMLLYETEKMIDRQVEFMVYAEEQFVHLAQAADENRGVEAPNLGPRHTRLRHRASRLGSRAFSNPSSGDMLKRHRTGLLAPLGAGAAGGEANPGNQFDLAWLEVDV
mmetsp:Transcript_102133/g.324506  ORF Transcript_102133/g.324506 Transcript_102133/m.324506 type:complete len:691 (-) Transcript_102133:77-2149(-)